MTNQECDMRESVACAECGAECVPSGCTTGYATFADGRKVCFPCADKFQRSEMASATRYGAYVSGDQSALTTWTGGELARIVSARRIKSGFGWSGQLAIRAVAPDGSQWYGRNGGAGMCINIRRAVSR